MKLLLCLLFCHLSIHSLYAEGCAGPTISTSLKNIHYGWGGIPHKTGKVDSISRIDSFRVDILHFGHIGCDDYKDLKVYWDNVLILDHESQWNGSKSFTLFGLPGHYKIYCCWMYSALGYWWEFDLVQVQIHADTASIASLPSIKVLNPNLFVYPNPASDFLYLLNESSEIQQVLIYSSKGELLFDEKPHSGRFTIPLESWPKGVYYLQAFILPEKTILKKILIE